MAQPFTENLSFESGFFSNTPISSTGLTNYASLGSKNVLFIGPAFFQSWGGVTVSPVANGQRVMGTLDQASIYTLNRGNAARFLAGNIVVCGEGMLFTSDPANASSGIQYNIPQNRLALIIAQNIGSNNAFTAGLPIPPPPTLSLGAALPTNSVAKPPQGTYRVRVALVRNETNSEGTASPASEPFTIKPTDKNKLRVTIQVPTLPEGGTFSLRFYATKLASPTGPYFAVVNRSGAAPDINFPLQADTEISFNDGELDPTAPAEDNDAPPPARFVTPVGQVLCLIGAEVGGVSLGNVLVSKPGSAEAFPISSLTQLSPNESPIAVLRPTDENVIVFTENSLQALVLTNTIAGLTVTPITIWPNTGIANPNAVTSVAGQLYGFAGQGFAFRVSASATISNPDKEFALPVFNLMQSFDPKLVTVGYDPTMDAVVYFHQNTALVYMVKTSLWSAPLELRDAGVPNPVQGATTFRGRLIFNAGFPVYTWQGENPNIPWKVVTNWRTASTVFPKTIYTVTVDSFFVPATKELTVEVLTNYRFTPVKKTAKFVNQVGRLADRSAFIKTNINNISAYSIALSSTGGGIRLLTGTPGTDTAANVSAITVTGQVLPMRVKVKE